MNDNNKISDLKEAKKLKRKKSGWSADEIEELAVKEMQEYAKSAEKEPEQLVSGDMQSIIDGDDNDEKNKQ